jgi:hypothetical protein
MISALLFLQEYSAKVILHSQEKKLRVTKIMFLLVCFPHGVPHGVHLEMAGT